MASGVTGQHALRGADEVNMRELINLIEKSCGIEEGKTKPQFLLPLFPVTRMIEEILVGMAADTNMVEMIDHFNNSDDAPVTGTDFWTATGASP